MSRERAFKLEDLPDFEGRSVHGASARIAASWPLDHLADVPLQIGDEVSVVVTLQCVGVAHVLGKQDRLVRVHHLKPAIVTVSAFDPADVQVAPLLRFKPASRPSRLEPAPS